MILRYTPEQWREYSEGAHAAVFGKNKPAERDRISYALLSVDEKTERLIGYVTVREHDHESVYWQFGGAFPALRNTTFPVRAYDEAIRYQQRLSKRIGTYVENTNYPMLKMALKFGFLIVGTRNFNGNVLVDLTKEFK